MTSSFDSSEGSSSATLEPTASRPSGPPVDADRVIAAEYDAFKSEVTKTVSAKLAGSRINFAAIDMDGFYNQAWYGLYTKLQTGDRIENRKGLLISMTYRRAIDEYRTLHADRQTDADALDDVGVDEGIDDMLDQQMQFRQFVEGMRSSLNDRELRAATLCYVYGLTRPEAAEQVGVKPKRMEKIMDEVSRKMRPLLAQIKDGEWCESRAELINQYALGALDEQSPEYREATDHLANCSGCRRHVLGTRGLTAVAPPGDLLLLAMTGALAASAATAGGAGAAAAASSGAFVGSTASSSGAGGTGAAAGSAAGGAGGAGGATGGAGAAGAASGGLGQVAAIAAAVGVVAVGGFAVATQVGGDEPASRASKPAATQPADNSAAEAAAKKEAAEKAAAKQAAKKRSAARKRAARRRAQARAEARAEQQAQAVTPTPTPEPVPTPTPAPTPTPSPQQPADSGSEFDLR